MTKASSVRKPAGNHNFIHSTYQMRRGGPLQAVIGSPLMRLLVPLDGRHTLFVGSFSSFQGLYQPWRCRPVTESGVTESAYDTLPDLFDFVPGNRRLIRKYSAFRAIHSDRKSITHDRCRHIWLQSYEEILWLPFSRK